MPSKARFTAKVSCTIHPALREAMDALAETHDRLVSDEVRAALAYHVTTAGDTRHDLPGPPLEGRPSAEFYVVVKPHHAARLDELAGRHGRSRSAELRVAIQRYLEVVGIDPLRADPQLCAADRLDATRRVACRKGSHVAQQRPRPLKPGPSLKPNPPLRCRPGS